MKKYIFLILVLSLSYQKAISQNTGSRRFMIETKSEYRFFNQGSQLVIAKKQWHLSFLIIREYKNAPKFAPLNFYYKLKPPPLVVVMFSWLCLKIIKFVSWAIIRN